ncbi:MAG: hypothetical protein JWL63_222 [Rhodocyclales bacterium]|nr:hypothetical protein [Rhodocyclales bacterium]
MQDRFVLISQWQLACNARQIWALLDDIGEWPRWWPEVMRAATLHAGNDDGTGKLVELVWRTPLLYRLNLQIARTRAAPPFELEGSVTGDLDGRGLWILTPHGDDAVIVTYRWDVRLSRPWMRRFAALLRPVFAWNHFQVMRSGAHGMAKRLGCRLSEYRDMSPRTPDMPGDRRRHA